MRRSESGMEGQRERRSSGQMMSCAGERQGGLMALRGFRALQMHMSERGGERLREENGHVNE